MKKLNIKEGSNPLSLVFWSEVKSPEMETFHAFKTPNCITKH